MIICDYYSRHGLRNVQVIVATAEWGNNKLEQGTNGLSKNLLNARDSRIMGVSFDFGTDLTV